MAEATQVDREKLETYVKQVSQQVMAGFNCSLSYVGDKMGLYRQLRDEGPVTSTEFAVYRPSRALVTRMATASGVRRTNRIFS